VPKKPTRKASNTKPRAAAGKPLPLDHPTNWLPIDELNGPLTQRNGGVRHLAAIDLNDALECGAVRCMCRNVRRGDRKHLLRTFWADFEFSSWSDGLFLMRRGHRGFAHFLGLVIYVWKPDVARRWPGLLKQHATPEGESEETRGRSPKYTPVELLALQLYQK